MAATTLSGLLRVLCCAGFVGTWASGRYIGSNIAPLLKLPALVMGGATLGILLAGGSTVITLGKSGGQYR